MSWTRWTSCTEPGRRPATCSAQADITTHRARIVGPIPFRAGSGRLQNIPIGPCLVEGLGGRSIDIVWGTRGQRSVTLPVEVIEAAQDHGHLVLLD